MIMIPLGVGSATPTADRHLASVALWRDGRIFLFDCGENAQMRMLQAGMKRSKIDYIFISHLDGDHFFGLPGLITTMQLQRRDRPLNIVAPEGIRTFMDATLATIGLDLCFDIVYHEIPAGTEHIVVVTEDEFTVEARKMEHSTYCVGYRLKEADKPGKVDAAKAYESGITEDAQFKALKNGQDVVLEDGRVVASAEIVGKPIQGKVFTYVTDTRFCENAVKLAENAAILYHEATFGHNLKDKAEETGHSTAHEAAIVARTANAQRLVIGHFSARYTNPFVLLKEAKEVFENTWVATELRPIMTDPEQERGIFVPPAPMQDRGRPPQRRGFAPRQGGFQQRRPYNPNGPRSYGDRPQRPYGDRPQRPYNPDRQYGDRPQRPYNPDRQYGDRPQRPYNPDRQYGDRPQRPYNPDRQYGDRPQRPYNPDRQYGDRPQRPYNPDRQYGDRPQRPYNPDRQQDPRPPRRDYRDAPREAPREHPPRDFRDSREVRENRPITPRNPFDEFDRF
jgi:ribonuclease Z